MPRRYDGSETMGYGMHFYDIAKLLKERREERGWSLNDAADRIGTSKSTVWQWERGMCAPSLPHLLRWCEVLDLQLELVEISRSTKKISDTTRG